MASLFTLSRAASLLHARHRPVLPAHHQLSQQRWLLEKGPYRC